MGVDGLARLLTPSNLRNVRFEVSGIEEYLNNLQNMGQDVEHYVKKAIGESGKPIFEDLKNWAERHKMTGAVLSGLVLTDVKKEGNYFYCDIGFDANVSPFSWHAVFVEYGTPFMGADPGVRPAFDNNKRKVKQIQRRILSEGGVPT